MLTIIKNKSFIIGTGISLILGLFIFWDSAQFPFLVNYDDGPLITENIAVLNFDIPRIFSEFVFGLYHPITTVSFALDNFVFNGNAAGFHWVSIILHVFNGILSFVLAFKLTKKELTASIVFILFVIHPMHVESVVWLSERKDLLYTLFFLLACITQLNSYDSNKTSKWNIITFTLFVLSVLSKSAAVVFPLVIILMDLSKRQFSWSKSLLKTSPYFIVSIVVGYVNVLAQKSAGFITELPSYSFLERFLMLCYSATFYVVQFILPYALSPKHFYPLLESGELPTVYYLSPFVLALLLYLAFRAILKKWQYLFPIGFFIITIILVLKIIPTGNDLVSDRYSYLPYFGLSLLLGVEIEKFYQKKNKNLVLGIGSLLVIGFSFISYNYSKVWQNEITLWDAVIDKNPNSSTAFSERGRNYHDRGNFKKALKDLNQAVFLDSSSAITYNQRGLSNSAIEKPEKAFNDFSKAIFLDNNYAEAYSNRGILLSKYGRIPEGMIDIKKAIEINPNDADYYNNLGIAFAQTAQFDSARMNFEKCQKLNPYHKGVKLNLERLNGM